MGFYPIMAKLQGKRCLVVGGGQVAERKIGGLLVAGADIVVVSPDCSHAVEEWAKEGSLTLFRRPFVPEDVRDALIVVAATNDPAVNLAVYQACGPHQWVNVVDSPDLCSFTVPSVVERGDLQIAISTGGHNPGLAKKLRRQVETYFGPEYAEYTAFLGAIRSRVLALSLDEKRKRELLTELLDDRFLQWTKTGERERRNLEAERIIEKARQTGT
ncbi:bifunctional precorrin-2 dehydrogenase/sirohydrochlorin ferrochelatase [Brevibacillus ruminantium]|uniref:precorrin-2 dehydrogenase n=1 Tax=Brevibacillus ruminantium TaxID=2950604 RepID=A0ABY4WIQ3_9BACL|nr:bifunctional precorrin-2 dehydrogenase/sirohydrochlorin ferrochelatase [Brevibacillus ruminantium]USG64526.1 bifunctional precorrin-2 dehydrogenase/sirohydrochlorin ferrochelatase [Brevibacillus ruminantium]